MLVPAACLSCTKNSCIELTRSSMRKGRMSCQVTSLRVVAYAVKHRSSRLEDVRSLPIRVCESNTIPTIQMSVEHFCYVGI